MPRLLITLLCLFTLWLASVPAHAGGRTGPRPGTRPAAGITLILVLDRSGSMSGPRLVRTRQAAALLIRGLRRTDWLGVLSFDTVVRVVSKLGRVGNRRTHLAAVKRLTAGGGTRFLPALDAARKLLKAAPANRHHHVLFLSDGQSARGGVMSAVHALVRGRATLSTIALGQGADTVFLAKMARAGKGRSYATTGAGLAAVCRKELRRLGR